jgi:hemolysin activation/secretion protein
VDCCLLCIRNLTGYGDSSSVTYAGSAGVNPQLDVFYTFPLTARDTTLALEYRKNDFTAIEEPFDPLDIDSRSNIYGFTIRHPIYRTPTQEFAFALTGEHLENKQFLLGTPFSFSPGVKNGKSKVTALRGALEWIDRSYTQVIAVRSRFSVGLDLWDATINPSNLPVPSSPSGWPVFLMVRAVPVGTALGSQRYSNPRAHGFATGQRAALAARTDCRGREI